MGEKAQLDRRRFLKISSLAGAGLVFSIYLSGCQDDQATSSDLPVGDSPTPADPGTEENIVEINLYVRIAGDGQITITVPRPDIGQGSRTAMAMIVAEEMGADWDDIRVAQAPPDPHYIDQVTGGSLGISGSYRILREAGAVVREVLIAAAAQMWGVVADECTVEASAIRHAPSGQEYKFSEVLDTAAGIEPPNSYSVALKDPSEFQIIGTSQKRVDSPQMVRGSLEYASDIVLEGMLYAVIERPPVFGSRLIDFDESAAVAVEGVQTVVEVSSGVAVVADSTWSALQGRRALKVTWEDNGNASLSSERIRQRLYDGVTPSGWMPGMDPPGSLSAVYEVPFLAHATPEPMMCVAHVTPDGCEVWAPTQNPRSAQQEAARAAGRSLQDVRLHVMVSGGGFGRRLQIDYVREAVEVSAAVGSPVKLFWTREDDIRHDFYHPLNVHYLEASLSPPGLPRIRSRESNDIPTGAWRSVGNFNEAFVRESFIDEMAAALNRNPLELRMEIDPASLHGVLQRAANEAGWGMPLPDGWGRGIACHSTWDVTPVAAVAEISATPEDSLKVERVVCAIDCGIVINPNMVREQMEGGIAFGLSAALNSGVTLRAGSIDQHNFHDYPILTMAEMPQVDVHILESDRDPSGVGEMGIPLAAPAVANAIFNLTGHRNRKFPLTKDLVVQST